MTYDLLLNSVSIPVVNNKVREDVTGISVLSLPDQCHFDS